MANTRQLSSLEQRLNTWVTDHLRRVSFVQKIFFLDHLRTMLHASLSLVEALDILSKEVSNKKLYKVIGEIKLEVESGQTLSVVLARYPSIFPSMYVKMIESGELSGKLDEALEHIVTQMQKTNTLNSSIRGAMIYPSVILAAMGGIGIMLATVVLPKLVEIFKEFDSALPLPTRILIAIVNVLEKPLFLALIIAGIIAGIIGFWMLLKKSPPFRRAVHALNLRLPIIGSVIQKINLARFSLTLSSLLKSTIPIVDAIDITADTCGNVLYQESLHTAAKRIKTGEALSVLLETSPRLFPPMVTEMIMVGERSGQVDQLLTQLSEFYSTEVDKTMKNFATIIEPVIIIILGIAIGGLAIAVILPMYSLVQNF
ncbi:MAG: type II secretion system F family protein [Patescibacteria group bacterium]